MLKQLLHFFFLLLLILSFTHCAKEKEETPEEKQVIITNHDLEGIIASDTLCVATMSGAISYFLFSEETMGYNYDLISNFAKHINVKLKIQLVNTEQELIDLLLSGETDIVAYNLYETKELKKYFHFVFPRFESHQVLIQRSERNSLLNASDLAGKNVHVKKNSIYHKRLNDLNNEIGGTINIVFSADSLTNDDLIEMILNHDIEYATAYYNDAAIHRIHSQKLDYHVSVGFMQKSGWLIRKNTPELLVAFEEWEALPATNRLQQRLESKYKLKNPHIAGQKIKIPEGAISPYDSLFQKYAAEIDWDWRLLASIAFHESTFDSASVSPAGAAGLMQIMPRTAEMYGVDSISIFNPEKNIKASTDYLKHLDNMFKKIENKDERIKFILAGYNGGPYHVVDAMALAERYGKNPYIWYDNVEYFLVQKNVPEFYQDSVVKYGSFNARETARYVDNTLSTYEKYLRKSKTND